MLEHKSIGQKQAFRFTRWSRNAAASFHSIKMVVNIGQLRANVVERIALKCSNALLSLLIERRVVVAQIKGQEYFDSVPPDLQEELLIAPTEVKIVVPATPI